LKEHGVDFSLHPYKYEEKGGTIAAAKELNVGEHLVIKTNIWGNPDLTQKYLKLKPKWGQYRSKVISLTITVQTKGWKYVARKKSECLSPS